MANIVSRIEGSKWEVTIVPQEDRGWFEHDLHGEGGGLMFDGKHLVDYDGIAMLPRNVWLAIEKAGYVVTEDFK